MSAADGGHWKVQLLGGFRVTRDGDPVVVQASAARLLAFLCLHEPLCRAEAAGVLWPDVLQARANANLRTAVWRLQKAGAALVNLAPDLIGVGRVVVDVHEIEQWVDAVLSPNEGREVQPSLPRRVGRVLLPSYDEEWLEHPRERLRLLQLQALETSASRLLARGRPGEALPFAIAAVQSAPLRESAHQLMIEIHLRQGNVLDAMAHYERYRVLLADELGVETGSAPAFSFGRYLPGESVGRPGLTVQRRSR